MKRLLIAFFTFYFSHLAAQTVTVPYQPGITSEGAVYFLPKTAIRITVQIEKTTYTPGDFCKYADRYLRLRDVPTEPSVTYRITSIRQEATSVADTNKRFAVKFDPKSVAANIALSDDGVLMAINATPKPTVLQQPFKPAPCPEPVNPRQYMSEEILAAGSTAKMAELTAQDIYEIRESRNLLTRGQADYMPKDGAQLQLMLNQLDMQDRSLTSLFAGTTQKDTLEKSMTIVPNKESKQSLLFRFSKKLGLVDDDDLAGVPYYINVKSSTPQPSDSVEAPPVDDKKRYSKKYKGFFVNVPTKAEVSLYQGDQFLDSFEKPFAQFGTLELRDGQLFKRYITHMQLDPATGAVVTFDVENYE